eukprot:scaffold86955_cov45-Phaeocystis_antarctica.AAC.1
MTAVQVFNSNPTAATEAYGPISAWDVTAVTDMSQLFYGFGNFNEDLSNWNTSSVTTMFGMFWVRSSPCCSKSAVEPSLHAACTAVARRPRPPGTLYLFPHRMPSFWLSAGRVGVQPAAELRHLQRQTHAIHVPQRVGVQPAAELRHLQRRGHGPHVHAHAHVHVHVHMFYDTPSLSDANKLLIRCAFRCAWVGVFASAGYGSSWGPGSCT